VCPESWVGLEGELAMLGYAGKLMVVDLSRWIAEEKLLDAETFGRCLGGRGLGAQLLYDLCPPKCRPFDPAIPFMVQLFLNIFCRKGNLAPIMPS